MLSLFNRVPSINTQQLKESLNNKPVIIDVRTAGEYRSGHIPGAKNVPLDKIGQYTKKSDQTLYIICQSGIRSKKGAKMLKKKGYDTVSVRGGMNQWAGSVRGGNN